MTRAQRIALAFSRRVSIKRLAATKVSENAALYSAEPAYLLDTLLADNPNYWDLSRRPFVPWTRYFPGIMT